MTNKNQTTKDKNHKTKKRRKGRLLLFAATLFLVLLVTVIAFRLFGSVDMVSSDISSPASTDPTDTTVSQTTQSKSTTSQTTIQKSETTTSTKTPDKHYIQPAGADWNLKLVNKWNPLDKNYKQPLVTYLGDNKFDSRAIDKLKALVNAGKAYNIRVASLYRTHELQTSLFERQVKREMAKGHSRSKAEELAATEVARPGTSEHNLGLAADFLFERYSSLETAYEKTEAYSWMLEHCADYGFILRFPKNKQSITGVIFEPWHYRYVGEQAAKEIMSRGITLEEYLQEKGK